jgi:hypothetical protein
MTLVNTANRTNAHRAVPRENRNSLIDAISTLVEQKLAFVDADVNATRGISLTIKGIRPPVVDPKKVEVSVNSQA